jgi:hypothetical protein
MAPNVPPLEIEVRKDLLLTYSQTWIGINRPLTTFRGEWNGKQEIFYGDDLSHPDNLPINDDATRCYQLCCHAGVTHEIRGNAVCLVGELEREREEMMREIRHG